MITGEMKNKVDSIWDTIWTGGITSPITVLEQITYLMFIQNSGGSIVCRSFSLL